MQSYNWKKVRDFWEKESNSRWDVANGGHLHWVWTLEIY